MSKTQPIEKKTKAKTKTVKEPILKTEAKNESEAKLTARTETSPSTPVETAKISPEVIADVKNKAIETLKKAHKKVNIPNMLTLFRIWTIPVIVFTFFFNDATAAWLGVFLFALASISDYMDGYLARHLNQLSRFGRVLDPIADKLLIGSILLMLAFTARLGDYGIIPAVVILCREILVSGLREFLAEIKVGCPVTQLAKWKTACQMCALPMLMVSEPGVSGRFADVFFHVGQFALWGAAILTVITGYDYWKSGRKYMDEE